MHYVSVIEMQVLALWCVYAYGNSYVSANACFQYPTRFVMFQLIGESAVIVEHNYNLWFSPFGSNSPLVITDYIWH